MNSGYGIMIIACFSLMVSAGFAADPDVDPISEREWTSDTGTKLRAAALELHGSTVVFLLSDGRRIEVPLARLAERDQVILRYHFMIEEEDADERTETVKEKESKGEVRERIEAGDLGGRMASISAYVPSSVTREAKRPAFCYADIRITNVESFDKLKAGSEVTGWPVVISSELSGRFPGDYVDKLSKGWLEAMDEKLPIDTGRLYGIAYGSGLDGLMLIEKEMGGYDGLLTVGGIFDKRHSRQSTCYGMIGLGSSSRVNFTKYFQKKAGRNSLIRYTAKGRGDGSSDDYEDGMIYLAIQYYADDGSRKLDELTGFVDRLLERARIISESDPERAYMWITQSAGLTKNEIQRKKWEDLQTELEGMEQCEAYCKGFELFQDLGYKEIGDAESSVDEKANEKIERELERMREELEDTKWIPVINSF